MQLIAVIGLIVAIVYYVMKMRAGAKSGDEDSDKSDQQGFMSDMFISSNVRANASSEKKTELGDELDAVSGKDSPILGDPYDDLEKLAALLEKGILTQDEFSAKKKEILERI